MQNKHLRTTSIVLFVLAQITSFLLLVLFIYRFFYLRGSVPLAEGMPTFERGEGSGIIVLIGGCLLYVAVTVALSIIFKNLSTQLRLNEMYDTFIANITHELKSPLASIQLYLETLKLRPVPKQRRDEFIDLMLQDALRLKNLINSILKVSMLEQKRDLFEYRRYRFDELVCRLMDEVRAQFKVGQEAIVLKGTAPVEVVVDENALQIVLSNLIDNAIKYSQPSELVTVDLSSDERTARLIVRDNGIGIPTKELKRIFQKFYRVLDHRMPNVKGTGLGLYWAKEIIRQHGGRITAFSEGFGKGSTFCVELPIYRERKTPRLHSLLHWSKKKRAKESSHVRQSL
ncbi:MAG: HAMP domain-containing histidine kinase [candidate division KSB1 bacterium]|nr:HAMP domain-containing histidine kinase [candidate division KSB1 bacterium]MDZ7346847.1 HAMP domain-containing histidine kinase [candidate division KSB1 bacterium]